ncbi:MAG: hypothetical protein H6R18_394 [Proteobacteria bacterium]|nr:hypothetical protein [Pseudomonadota bacterium]
MSSLANEWIERLGQELGLGHLEFAARGIVEVRFEGDIAVTIERSPAGDVLLLHMALGRVGADALAQGALFEELLRMNHAGNNPLGMILAIDESDGELVLSHGVAALEPAQYEDLVAGVQQLIVRAQAVQALLDQTPVGNEAPPPASSEVLFHPNMLA